MLKLNQYLEFCILFLHMAFPSSKKLSKYFKQWLSQNLVSISCFKCWYIRKNMTINYLIVLSSICSSKQGVEYNYSLVQVPYKYSICGRLGDVLCWRRGGVPSASAAGSTCCAFTKKINGLGWICVCSYFN